MKSAYLSLRQLDALQRVGNLLVPGVGKLPSFSETDSLSFVDEILRETPEPDVKDLAILLTALSFLPDVAINWLVGLAQRADSFPGLIGGQLRLLNLGLRGVIFSLYYSGKIGSQANSASPLQAIGFELVCIAEPTPQITSHRNNL